MRAVERVLEEDRGFRDVNSIFGEGRSPKLRKLRAGLTLLGFDPSAVLQHHQPRCIYGMRLSAQTGDFLVGKADTLPGYIERPEEYRDATDRIAAFWRERWLASRLDHAPALESLASTPAWRLSEIAAAGEERRSESFEMREQYRAAAAQMHRARRQLVEQHAARLDLVHVREAARKAEQRFWEMDREARAYPWFSCAVTSDS